MMTKFLEQITSFIRPDGKADERFPSAPRRPLEEALDMPSCLTDDHSGKSDLDADYDTFIWNMSKELEQDPDLQNLMAQYQSEIVASSEKSSVKHPARKWKGSFWLMPTSLAAAVITVVMGTYFYNASPTMTLYDTPVGQQRTVTLGDKSVITLNTDSAVRVAYTDQVRELHLDKGEAIFTVAKDPNRPFYVHTGAGIVRAIGTEFNILIDPDNTGKVIVSVLEGRISINDETSPSPRIILPILKAGEEISLAQELSPLDIKSLDTARINGWRAGQIVFHDVDLAKAIKDHNRYAKTKIVLNDNSFATRKISGTFRIGDTTALIFALQNLLNVDVEQQEGKLLLKKRGV